MRKDCKDSWTAITSLSAFPWKQAPPPMMVRLICFLNPKLSQLIRDGMLRGDFMLC